MSIRKDATALGLTIDPAQARTCELRRTGLLLVSIIPSYMPTPVPIERVTTLITSGQRDSVKYVTEAYVIWNRFLEHTSTTRPNHDERFNSSDVTPTHTRDGTSTAPSAITHLLVSL